MQTAKPDVFAPHQVLRAVILAFVYTVPDWPQMAKLFADYEVQTPLTDDLASIACRAYAFSMQWEAAVKVYERVQSGALRPRFTKPQHHAALYRNAVDAYGALRQFDLMHKVLETALSTLSKEYVSSVVVGVLNALSEAGKADEALAIFSSLHKADRITVDPSISAAVRKCSHPVFEERERRSENDRALLSEFLSENMGPKEALAGAWAAYEEASARGELIGISAYVTLLNLLLNAAEPSSGDRAAQLVAEAEKAGEIKFDRPSVTSALHLLRGFALLLSHLLSCQACTSRS